MGCECRDGSPKVKERAARGAAQGTRMRKVKWWWGVGLAAAVLAIGIGVQWRDRAAADSAAAAFAARPLKERNLAVFDAACELIEKNYYNAQYIQGEQWRANKARWREKAATNELFLYPNVLNNLARSFPESHVAFIDPPVATPAKQPAAHAATPARKQLPERIWAAYKSGAGYSKATVRRATGARDVVSEVLRGSPAERAGVTPGWLVNGGESIDINPDRVLFSANYLVLDREEEHALDQGRMFDGIRTQADADAFMKTHTVKLQFNLEPLQAPPPDFETRKLPGGVTYVRFDNFENFDLVSKALDVIDNAGPAGLVIDLRRNPGGLGVHLMRVMGALLGGGETLGKSRNAKATSDLISLRLGEHYEGPVVILIAAYTASAAEITAAAMQDLKRGKLVGRDTSGAVLMSSHYDLPDGGQVQVPVSDFLRLDGRRIEGIGVQPDVWVVPTLEDVRAGRDPVLERALRELTP